MPEDLKRFHDHVMLCGKLCRGKKPQCIPSMRAALLCRPALNAGAGEPWQQIMYDHVADKRTFARAKGTMLPLQEGLDR